MRGTHDGKPAGAVFGSVLRWYRHAMKSTSLLPRVLRGAALALLLLGLGVWIASGARVGWTQTSAVTLQKDEITGIEYPVRRTAFLPGLEVPALGAAAAAALAGLSLLARRSTSRA